MPSPKVSFRLEPERYAVLVKLAKTEKKSMTDLVRGLVDEALAKREEATAAKGTEGLQKRIEEMLEAVTKLLNGTFEQSAKAHFYGRLGIEYANDVITYLVQKQELDKASKEHRRGQAEKEADRFVWAQWEERFSTAKKDK